MTSPSKEAIERKARSEVLLRAQGIPINIHLPFVETAEEVHLRTKDEVAYRTLVLLTVGLKGEGLEQAIVNKLVDRYGLAPHFSPDELAFMGDETDKEKERAQFTWRYEGAWVLLWALGYIELLEKPSAICDVVKAVSTMKERTIEQFLEGARLRPVEQILDEADLIYRYHWAVVDARINNRPTPSAIDPGVVYERHYALNWLVRYMDQNWDEISTDT